MFNPMDLLDPVYQDKLVSFQRPAPVTVWSIFKEWSFNDD